MAETAKVMPEDDAIGMIGWLGKNELFGGRRRNKATTHT